MTTNILPATAQHSTLLARLAKQTFVDAFGKDNNEADLNEYVDQAFSESAIQQELVDPNATFYVAYEDETPLGYVKLRKGTVPEQLQGQRVLELQRIYVHQHATGRGIGAQLMQKAITHARQQSADVLWLGVWEHNPTAIAFYRRWGFSVFGSHIFYVGHDPQTDLLMQCIIGATFRPANPLDHPTIRQLLVDQQLPVDDLSEAITFFVASDASGTLIATCGVERYGPYGLLRSVAVRPDWQGQGIGRRLVEHTQRTVATQGVEELFLLTTTAPGFFQREGYEPVDRAAVPEKIRLTTEFSSVCPSTAVCLRKKLIQRKHDQKQH